MEAGDGDGDVRGGLFLGVEHTFASSTAWTTRSRLLGGTTSTDYQQVCSGHTGHAETVLVMFDAARIGYEQLLAAFWQMHDPTQLNRQGPDFGTQYRSAIFVADADQRAAAAASKAAEDASGRYRKPIVTEITDAGPFYRAEEYHQRYFEKHGIQGCHR